MPRWLDGHGEKLGRRRWGHAVYKGPVPPAFPQCMRIREEGRKGEWVCMSYWIQRHRQTCHEHLSMFDRPLRPDTRRSDC
ncbi:hypothetical protein ATCV1_z520R [Acanthocystis turfacea chlorella virus 1]|uniref:Uncharacterized protein z520R n=1 Tax=Chlorovirus heliozoae TaxID=322019 RepID=A7K9D0_9PHYC|nr:hypothetical protein ATCV1_z520R [Acanthocystis turfacea chlorella virus 1]ABT16654.1 hypothetical protein ATCV1_z520R [Acanthocystis turfacea chlorella virus 1]